MPKPILLVLAGVLVAFLPAGGTAQDQGSQAPAAAQPQPAAPAAAPAQAPAPVNYPRNPVKPTAESQSKAKTLYQMDCSMCHGDNGNGKSDLATSMELTLGDWTDPKTLAGHADGEFFAIIRSGKDKMPPEESGRASDDQVWNLVIYIRSFSKGQAGAASSAAK
jgi:mono/diheme cytochrome c family protein